jgi:hypothetical protein
MAHRQFIKRESMSVVLCEWDARKGAWRCSSAPGSPYNRRVDTLSHIVSGMKADGYEEVTPTLRRVGQFSKSENKYVPLAVIDSKTPEVTLTLPVKSGHPSKPTTKHFPL